MLIISNDDVQKVLDMGTTLDALEGVYREMAIGDAVGMGRIDLYVPSAEPVDAVLSLGGDDRRQPQGRLLFCARMLSDMVNGPRQPVTCARPKMPGCRAPFADCCSYSASKTQPRSR
jgi:hypothetical protein